MNKETAFYEKLKEKGYKLTNQRKLVFEAILAHKDDHVTAENLYQYLIKKNPEIGLSTVYRNVQLLVDLNLVNTLNLDDGFVRYELAHDTNKHNHHHLVCTHCNKVIEVKEDLMESIENLLAVNYGFLVCDHQVKFTGLCEDCRKKVN